MSNSVTRVVVLALVVAMLAICALLVQTTEAATADQLWNKYRVKLVQLLQRRFRNYKRGIKTFGGNTNIARTTLHIVTDPVDAMWGRNINKLNDFAGYVPQWTTSWKARHTKDNSQCEKYKKMLFSHKDKSVAAKAFVNFNKLPKSMEESHRHEKLAHFIKRTKNTKPNAFHFVVEETRGSVSIGTAWGRKTTTFRRMSSMVRSLEKSSSNRALWDDVTLGQEDTEDTDQEDLLQEEEEEEGEVEEEEIPDDEVIPSSEFLFRRRRRRRRPKPKPIVIKSKKFHMDMRARGLIGIPIRAKCINRNFIRKNRSKFKGRWFGRRGNFALTPSIIWVAMRPKVVLRLSASEFKTVQRKWRHRRTLGLAVAGTLFRNRNFRVTALSDDADSVLGDMFPSEALTDMRQNDDLMDSATFVVKSANEEGKEVVMQEGALEDFVDQDGDGDHDNNDAMLSEDNVLAMQDDTVNEELGEEIPEDEAIPSSDFLFRRRRRRRRRRRPKPPTIKEKVYEARFQSNSQYPQVLAVTSDIL